jgi:hypothetical protein
MALFMFTVAPTFVLRSTFLPSYLSSPMSNNLDIAIVNLRKLLDRKATEILNPLTITQTESGPSKNDAARVLFGHTVSFSLSP